MPIRNTTFVDGYYYHVFNRGVERRSIFLDRWDYKRFLKTLVFYNDAKIKSRLSWQAQKSVMQNALVPIVSILSFSLMPNHYHFLLRQEYKNGISTFMRKVSNSYTKYFNTKYKRVGPLFQGPFRAVLVKSDEQLIHVVRYIHLNPFVNRNLESVTDFYHPYSSYNEYLGKPIMCDTKLVKQLFRSKQSFKEFHLDHFDHAKSLEDIKHIDESY